MYKRILENDLQKLSRDWSIISVTGPRQSGKTTLCKMAFPDYDYINLEQHATRMLVLTDTEAYLSQFQHGVIIDEAQHVPEVFSCLQVLADEYPDRRYILSGSSDFLLMQNISQSLAGRVAVRRLLPLSLAELGDDATISADELMFRGFYPAVWSTQRTPQDVYDSYLSTYIQRDVRQITNVGDLDAFQHFLMACAARVGSEWNSQAISNEVAVSNVTVKRWMSILEASYTAFCLHPYFRNIGKRLSKTPKIYFYDTGLVCQLLGITDVSQLQHHPLRGAIFENMVVVDMLKQRFNEGKRNNLFFYRDKSGKEVDVLCEEGNGLRAYEIKSAQSIHPSFFSSLDYIQRLLGDDLLSSAVIYNGQDTLPSTFRSVLNFRNI